MTLTHPPVVLVLVVIGVTLSTICLSLSSFFYLTAVRERASIAAELHQQQETLQDLRQQYDHALDTEEQDVSMTELDEETSLRMLDPRLTQHRVLQKKKTIQERFIIVCQPGRVFPPPGYTTNGDALTEPWYYDGSTGSELILRGVVFDGQAKTIQDIVETGPKKLQDSYYTQKCTAIKGTSINIILAARLVLFRSFLVIGRPCIIGIRLLSILADSIEASNSILQQHVTNPPHCITRSPFFPRFSFVSA